MKLPAGHRRRSYSGQIMGVVDLLIIVPATVMCVLLLLNVGVSTYYKEKLAFISNQAAEFAYTLMQSDPQTTDSQVTSETKTFVNALLPKFGLPSQNMTITVSRETVMVGTTPKLAANVAVTNDFNLLGTKVNFLPTKITLTDKASAISATTVLAAAGPPGPPGPPGTAASVPGNGELKFDRVAWVSVGLGGTSTGPQDYLLIPTTKTFKSFSALGSKSSIGNIQVSSTVPPFKPGGIPPSFQAGQTALYGADHSGMLGGVTEEPPLSKAATAFSDTYNSEQLWR